MKNNQNNNVNVLIAEDDNDLRESLETGFVRKGFNVKTVSDGKKAYDVLHKWPVDTLITDIRMPEGSGVDLINKISEMNDDKPSVICITGYSDLKQAEAFEKGVDAYFQKPVSSDLLISAATHFANKRRAMKQLETILKKSESTGNPGMHLNLKEVLALTTQIVEEFTALWGYTGMLAETVNQEGIAVNKKRLQWCSKKLEEFSQKISEEVVLLKGMLEKNVEL